MQETLVTLMVLAACAAAVFGSKEQIFKTFEWYSSPLDWCEQNEVYSPYIVEFWNTVTSALLAVIGIAGWWVYKKNPSIHKYEPQFVLVWAIMFVVGVGSVWFHGTLSVAGQVSDEVPIVVLACVAIMMARPKANWSGKSREIALNGHTLVRATTVLCVFCLFFPVVSHLFTLVCFPGCGYYFLTDYAKSKNPQFKALFWTAIGFFCLAFTSWITDRVACEQMTKFGEMYLGGYPQLHAIWHVLIGTTFWLLIALGIVMRAEQDGVQFSIQKHHGVLPVVHMMV